MSELIKIENPSKELCENLFGALHYYLSDNGLYIHDDYDDYYTLPKLLKFEIFDFDDEDAPDVNRYEITHAEILPEFYDPDPDRIVREPTSVEIGAYIYDKETNTQYLITAYWVGSYYCNDYSHRLGMKDVDIRIEK